MTETLWEKIKDISAGIEVYSNLLDLVEVFDQYQKLIDRLTKELHVADQKIKTLEGSL